MKINEIIKEKRIKLGYTQEQVANYLNVSIPAVSKWENGSSYPDITLLPILARLLKTDLNTLLAFKNDLSDYEVIMFVNQLAELKNFNEAYQKGMDKINEYPTCYNLILNVTLVLAGMCSLYNSNKNNEYQQIFEQLYRRTLISDDQVIKNQAQSALISMYLNNNELLKAEELINQLPDVNCIDKRNKLADLYQRQGKTFEAAKIIEEKILMHANDILNNIMKLLQIMLQEKRFEDANLLAEKYYQIAKNLDCWQYSWYLGYFELYSKTKNKIKLTKTISKMLKSLNIKWDINASSLYHHIKTKEVDKHLFKDIKDDLLNELKTDPEYSFIKNEIEIK
ncbi:helix-turn-helix domain-containing protein [Thomasclavelia sp.]